MKALFRFKLRLLLLLVLIAAIGFGAAAMVVRSRTFSSKAQEARSQYELYRHSAELAKGYKTLHLLLAESPDTSPQSAAHEKDQAETSRKEEAFFEDQAARVADLKEEYERLASHPWQSEPPRIEEMRRKIRDARHPSFP